MGEEKRKGKTFQFCFSRGLVQTLCAKNKRVNKREKRRIRQSGACLPFPLPFSFRFPALFPFGIVVLPLPYTPRKTRTICVSPLNVVASNITVALTLMSRCVMSFE